MKELVRTNDVVLISWLVHALEQQGIRPLLLDQHMSAVEGSLGILPRRILVADGEFDRAKAVLDAGPEIAVVEGIVLDRVASTADSLLGGRIVFYQPAEGYRAAIDPVLLAAAMPARAGDRILDLGGGAGAAALCLARRVLDCHITGLEIDPALVALARTNAAENGFGGRIEIVAGNVVAPPASLAGKLFDGVLLNPPFNAEDAGTPPPGPEKRRANVEAEADLGAWLGAALRFLRAKGNLAVIHRADRIDAIVASLYGKAGDIVVLPLWPRTGKAAKRVIVRARKGAAGGARLLPGLMLHEPDGAYTAEADSILRHGNALAPND